MFERLLEKIGAALDSVGVAYMIMRKRLKRFSKDLGEAFLERFEHLLL